MTYTQSIFFTQLSGRALPIVLAIFLCTACAANSGTADDSDSVDPASDGDADSDSDSDSDSDGDADSAVDTEEEDTTPIELNIDYDYPEGSPVAINGNLQVNGNHLVNESGDVVQLKGMSSYGLQWGGQILDDDALLTQFRNWGFEMIRLAMYANNDGYADVTDAVREDYETLINSLVRRIGQLGMYVIIDWHVLDASGFSGDPWAEVEMAKQFFENMSEAHANKPHVMFEICNEPSPASVEWVKDGDNNDIKEYAETIIPIIREKDKLKSVVIVGTPVWSTEPAAVLSDPLTLENVMYALHFYAGYHYSRHSAEITIENAPVFASEWGVSNETGRGGNDYENADAWLDMLDAYQVSWCNWSISWHESSSFFQINEWGFDRIEPPYEDKLSESGRYLLHRLSGATEPFVP